ncbi:MAG: DUF3786 domain-containing protein [Nitrospirae bacterium]|nr:DUF3786 domain-containing protein [Nitrospirota bacterium]
MNQIDIYKLLNKTNCGDCKVRSCMGFAVSVMNGERKLSDCPHLDVKTLSKIEGAIRVRDQREDIEKLIDPLKEKIALVDFQSVAAGLGAEFKSDMLAITCLGKEFLLDRRGDIHTLCHVNPWLRAPLLHYTINSGNAELTGEWISYGGLKNGIIMDQYFTKRCEEPLRDLADKHEGFLEDIFTIFKGKAIHIENADISWIISPFPKVPFLVMYWKAEKQLKGEIPFESKLKILFDKSTDNYLNNEIIYVLGRGLVEMFTKICIKHYDIIL